MDCRQRLLFVALLVGFSSTYTAEGRASEGRGLRTQSVAEAGQDYLIQGEYIGSYERGGTTEMFGVQVIARGSGTFEAYGLRGGLPGAGWDRSAKMHFEGKVDGKKTILKETDGKHQLVVRGRRLRVRDDSGSVVGRLHRVIRKSPTLGLKAPECALMLFDGTTTEHFVAHKPDGPPVTMTADGFLELTHGSGGINTRKTFQSTRVHLEFRLPFEPEGRGQERGNSGLYLQGRYELQLLDSFGLEGVMEECGGIYSIAAPAVNMCFPPLSWQTYDVEFTAAKYDEKRQKVDDPYVTVHHNGGLIHDHQSLPKKTTAAPEKPRREPRGHHLQDHGHNLLFRNIWVVER